MRTFMLCSFLLLPLAVKAQVWYELPPMPTPRYAAATAVLNGHIYIIGGIGKNDSLLTTVEAYDPVRNIWIRELPQLDEPRAYAAAVTWANRLYLIGGLEGDLGTEAAPTDDVLVFDPENGWKEVASLKQARYGLTAIVFKEQIYAIGGMTHIDQMTGRLGTSQVPLNTIEIYDVQEDEWQLAKTSLYFPVSFMAAALLGEDVYIIGGLSSNGPVKLIQRYRPATNEMAIWKTALPQEWWAGSALTYQDQVILLGGLGGARGNPLTSVYAFQFKFNGDSTKFRELPALQQARFSFAAVVYRDTLFVFGGLDQLQGHPLNSAEAASAAILTPRETAPQPADFFLAPPYPHPFREQVTFTFSVSTQLAGTPVQLLVYDVLGRPVARLLEQSFLPGQHAFSWDGTDAAGHPVPDGVYLLRLIQGPYHQERLLIRIR